MLDAKNIGCHYMSPPVLLKEVAKFILFVLKIANHLPTVS